MFPTGGKGRGKKKGILRLSRSGRGGRGEHLFSQKNSLRGKEKERLNRFLRRWRCYRRGEGVLRFLERVGGTLGGGRKKVQRSLTSWGRGRGGEP